MVQKKDLVHKAIRMGIKQNDELLRKLDDRSFSDSSVGEYWQEMSKAPTLERLDKPCHDCAITTGFYTPIINELLEQDITIQDRALNAWDCHNECNKACRGAYNYIHSKRKDQKAYQDNSGIDC